MTQLEFNPLMKRWEWPKEAKRKEIMKNAESLRDKTSDIDGVGHDGDSEKASPEVGGRERRQHDDRDGPGIRSDDKDKRVDVSGSVDTKTH